MLFSSLVATTEIGAPTLAPARREVPEPDEEATRRETRREAAIDPDEKRSDVFRTLSV